MIYGTVDFDLVDDILAQNRKIFMRCNALFLRRPVVVDDDDCRAIVQKRLRQMRPDEPCPACDDDPFAEIIARLVLHMRLISAAANWVSLSNVIE